MNTPTYRNILRLLEKWPIDQSKLGRDLGEYLRTEITSAFNPSQSNKLNIAAWDKIHASLNRIASDRYKTLYPTSPNIETATGLTADACNAATSNDCMKELEEEEEGSFIQRVSSNFRRRL